MLTELGRELSLVEKESAIGYVLTGGLGPRLRPGWPLHRPIKCLGNTLMRPAALVVPDCTLKALELIPLWASWTWTCWSTGSHQTKGVAHIFLGRVIGDVNVRPHAVDPLPFATLVVVLIDELEVGGHFQKVDVICLDKRSHVERLLDSFEDPFLTLSLFGDELVGIWKESDW